MGKKILITGITGFVGRHTARAILRAGLYDVTAIVRPNTDSERLEEFVGKIEIVEIDLCDLIKLQSYLGTVKFDVILHIGALLRQRKFFKQQYIDANVNATELLAKNALKNNSKFIFCSTVSIYGTVPKNVPADRKSEMVEDTIYSMTKIEAEKRLKLLIGQGLNCNIVRPSIIYGKGDENGFPNILVKLVSKRILFFPRKPVRFHLTNINLLVEVFLKILEESFWDCFDDIVVDDEPVLLDDLANFISMNLGKGKYGKWHKLPNFVFDLVLFVLKIFGLNEMESKISFLSKDWYYKSDVKMNLGIETQFCTIPQILPVVKESCNSWGVNG